MSKNIGQILYYVISLSFLWYVLDSILALEFSFLPVVGKWTVCFVGIFVFVIWTFLWTLLIKNLKKYIYITLFVFSVSIVTFYSKQITHYQDKVNFNRAQQLVFNIEKGKQIDNEYYWLGLSVYPFDFQKENGFYQVLTFQGEDGCFHRYDFNNKEWSLND